MKKPTKPATKPKASVRPITGPAGVTYDPDIKVMKTAAAAKLDLTNLDLEERAFLRTCQDIYRNNIGCYTPFESFFLDLVHSTMRGDAPTLESIRAELADAEGEFAHNWDGVLQGVKRFVRNYPDLIADLQNAAKGEAKQPAETAHA